MNKRLLNTVLVSLGLLCFSCSSTHWVYNDPHAYEEFNKTMLDRSVTIGKIDGSIIETDSVWADTSGVFTCGNSEKNEVRLAFDEVKRIDYIDHGTGAAYGMLIGAGSGALIFLLAGSSEQKSQKGTFSISFSPGDLALGGAILGILPGLLIGAAIGHTQHYQFSADPPPEGWIAGVNRMGDKQPEQKLVRVEVISAERNKSGRIIIRWKKKTIRLSESDVYRIERSGEKTIIWVPENIYENEFIKTNSN